MPADPSRHTFVYTINKQLEQLGIETTLTSSLSEPMFKTHFVDKVNEFLETDPIPSKISSITLGKIENANTYIVSDKVRNTNKVIR